MTQIGQILQLCLAGLSAAAPGRIVTRDLKDFGDRSRDELNRSVLTLQLLGQTEMEEFQERLGLAVVGQVQLPERSAPHLVEDAELDLMAVIRRWADGVRSPQVRVVRWQSSQQLEAPYGWVRAEIRVGPLDLSEYVDPASLDDFLTFYAQTDIEPFAGADEHYKWLQEPPDHSASAPDAEDIVSVRG